MNEEIIPLIYALRKISDTEYTDMKVIESHQVMNFLNRYLINKLMSNQKQNFNIKEGLYRSYTNT